MKIVFDGKVLVFSAVSDNKSYLMVEVDKGSGVAGEVTTDTERQGGCVVDIDKLSGSEDVVMFEFSKPESVAVVIEKLQECLMYTLNLTSQED